MFHASSNDNLASASALFKNPVPIHGPKRNTACQQCRKRKLKCDMKRPCSTCVRSHTYARTHSGDKAEVSDEPDCTYGDEKEQTPPSNKVEKLENRINELETLLEQMKIALEASQSAQSIASLNGRSTVTSPMVIPSTSQSYPSMDDVSIFASTLSSPFLGDSVIPEVDFMNAINNVDILQYQDYNTPNYAGAGALESSPSSGAVISVHSDRRSQLLASGWPQHLPEPEVTRHLVHAFFAFYIHAGRLFHGPTFLASLDLHPSNPRFPFSSVLHAMCAIGSLYTADIPQPPTQPRSLHPSSGEYFTVDELFPGRWREYDQRPDSFAEQHAKFAKIAGEAALDRGEHLLECLQSQVMLTWFYVVQARWSEAFIAAGQALRCAVPCGLNISAPFHTITKSFVCHEKPPTILGEPQSIFEVEMRRNVFWIAYSLERQLSSGSSFAMALDDMDICQLLPLRGDLYERGIDVPAEERQWSHDPKMLLTHPPKQTDSFVLFVKAAMLLSFVKNWNLRFRGRYFAGDARLAPATSPDGDLHTLDPRQTPAFQELDHIASSFRASFPAHLRNPVQDEMVDPYLYSACSAAHLAQMLLHEPHARAPSSRCPSANKVVVAARAILELMYSISSTSYDVCLLDHLPILAWNCCGRVLIKALRAALDMNDYEESMVLQAEISYIYSMLAKAGERLPLAYRYKKMVMDLLASSCGRDFAAALPRASYQKARFPTPPDTSFDDTMSFMNTIFSPATAPFTTGLSDTPM